MATIEELTRQYRSALLEWEIGLTKALAGCASRDAVILARNNYFADHEIERRELEDLRSELDLTEAAREESLQQRFVEAHEALVEEHRRANEREENRQEVVQGEVVNKET